MNIVKHSSVLLPVITSILSLPALVILFAVSRPIHILEIAHAEGRCRVFWTQISPGDRFSLEYTHSVQLCRVADNFEIDQHYGICLVSTSFSDHGAGLPHSLHKGEDFSVQDDGRFKISGIRARLPKILLRVGREYDNTFISGPRRINLSEICGNALLEVRIRKYRFPLRSN